MGAIHRRSSQPAVRQPAHEAATAEPRPDLHTILLVDDDPALRRALARALVHAGYDVLCASRSFDALALLEAEARRIDLLVVDLTLPDLPGPDLAARLQRERPELQVLFVTGHDPGYLHDSGSLPTGGDLLGKPFSIPTLLARIAEALAEPVPRL